MGRATPSIRRAFTDWYEVVVCVGCNETDGMPPAAIFATRRGLGMDSIGGARIAVYQLGFAPVDSIEDQLREIRRERDALRRENRVLKIAVAELERVSERDTLTPLFNRRYFLTAIHQRIALFQRPAETGRE